MGSSKTEKNPEMDPITCLERTFGGIEGYRTTIKSDDGHTVYGYGGTPEVSQQDASEKLSEARESTGSKGS